MSDETLKKILLTTGYTKQIDKEAVYDFIQELKKQVVETEDWLRVCILNLMKEYNSDSIWITNQQIEISRNKNICYEQCRDKDTRFYQNTKK